MKKHVPFLTLMAAILLPMAMSAHAVLHGGHNVPISLDFGTVASVSPANSGADNAMSDEMKTVTVTIVDPAAIAAGCTIDGGGNYAVGSSVTLTAHPAGHYHFVGWSEGDNSGELTYTFTVTDNTEVRVFFAADKHQITVNVAAGQESMGSVSGTGVYEYNVARTITATAAEHYHFVMWNDSLTVNPRTITVEAPATYTATFAIDEHTVTLNVAAECAGMGTVAGAGTFNYGTTQTLTATAAEHYHFVMWNDSLTVNPRSFVLEQDTHFTAIFELDTHLIDATIVEAGMGSVNGIGYYNYGTTQTLTAVPAEHHHFMMWSDSVMTATRTITVEGDAHYTAIFAIDTHTVAVVANDNTLGTVAGGGEFAYGTEITISATPIEHYHLGMWNDSVTDAVRTITVEGDATYTANFTIDQFMVTGIINDDPSMGTIDNAGLHNYGETVTLTAVPAEHHHFVAWGDGYTRNTITVEVLRDTTVEATFAIDNFNIVTDYDTTMGSVTGAGNYNYGTAITVEAIAKPHYHFVAWRDGETSPVRNFNVTENKIFEAIFAIDEHVVAVTYDTTSGTVTGAGTYAYGTEITLEATPAEGYHFSYFNNYSNIESVDSNVYELTVDGDMYIFANFSINYYQVTVATNDATMGVANGSNSYAHGSTATLSAVAMPHCHFVVWSDGDSNAVRTITVTDSAEYTAIFARDQFAVSVVANDATMGTTNGTGNYNYGDSVVISATANAHHTFVAWNDGDTNATRTIVVTDTVEYIANFSAAIYSLNVVANDATMGTVTGNGNFAYGSTATISAIANAHYHFVAWNDGNIEATRTVTVEGDTTYTATFEADLYVVGVNANNDAMGTVTGSGSYAYLSEATLTATPAAHHTFVSWNDGNTNATRIITVTNDAFYTATFAVDQYTVSVASNNATMGTVSGAGTFNYGTSTIIAATAAAHYHFVAWNDGNTDAVRTITVENNVTYTATFEADQYTINAVANDATMGTVTGSGIYGYNTTATLTATAAANYSFVAWNDGNTNATRTITVEGDATYTATFAVAQHTLTVAANNEAMGTVTGSGVFAHGTNTIITATANAHHSFVAWNDGNTDATRIVTVNADVTYTATFAADQYTIAVAANDEAMGTVTGAGSYAYGTTATLTATAAEYHYFVVWSDGDSNATRTITVEGDATYTATFAAETFTVATAVNNEAMGTVYGAGVYAYGNTATLEAVANEGYSFVAWNDGDSNAIRTVVVNSDTTFTATFAAETLTLTVLANDDAMGTVTGSGNYNTGDTATLTATAAAHHHFVVWNDGDSNATRTVVVNSNATYVATFEVNTYALNVVANNEAMGTVTGSGNYTYGATATIAAAATAHHHFVAWNDGNTNAIRTITVDGDATYTATFAADQYTLTVVTNDATMGSVTGAGSYTYGTTVTLTATAAAHHHFVAWSDGSSNATRTVTVTENATFTAIFAADVYTITVASNDENMGTVIGAGEYDYGTTAVIAAVAKEGYAFVAWNDGNTESVRSITVTGNATYTATFSNVGIDDVENTTAVIYSEQGNIVVKGAANEQVYIYDAVGRCITKTNGDTTVRMENTGVYLVKVGNAPAQRVVVVR